LTVHTCVARSPSPTYPYQQAGDYRVRQRPRDDPVDVEQAVAQDGHADAQRHGEEADHGEDGAQWRLPGEHGEGDAGEGESRACHQPLQLLAAFAGRAPVAEHLKGQRAEPASREDRDEHRLT
jgi:hypothetical protein